MSIRARLLALDERFVYGPQRRGQFGTFGHAACIAPTLAYIATAWSHSLGWPLAVVAALGLGTALIAIARFWFGHAHRR